MPIINFTITSNPIPASRPRVFRNGGRSYSANHLQYEAFLLSALPAHAPVLPIVAPVSVACVFTMPRPKKATGKPARADLDNLAKILLDAMTKQGFWHDDSLVTELHLTKRYANEGEFPHTDVTVTYK